MILPQNEAVFAYEYFPDEWRLRILLRSGRILVVNAMSKEMFTAFTEQWDKERYIRTFLLKYFTVTEDDPIRPEAHHEP